MTHEEFDKMYRQYKDDWARLAATYTKRDFEGGEDIVQEVLTKLMEKKGLDFIDANDNPDSYIRHAIVQYIRRYVFFNKKTKDNMQFHERFLKQKEWDNLDEQPLENDTTPPDPLIEQALASLLPHEHDVLCLRLYGEVPFKEIMKGLGLKKGRAEELYYLALKKLRLFFESVGIEDPSSFYSMQHERSHDV